jgi:predicted nuclease with TOPRIM domain
VKRSRTKGHSNSDEAVTSNETSVQSNRDIKTSNEDVRSEFRRQRKDSIKAESGEMKGRRESLYVPKRRLSRLFPSLEAVRMMDLSRPASEFDIN